MKVGIFGRGRLGSAVARLVGSQPDLELTWIIDKGEEPSSTVEAVLDASSADAVAGHARWAIEQGVDLVVGATGWNAATLDGLDFSRTGILVAPNFSLAIAFLRRAATALGRFAAMDADVDLSIVERHHRMKVDAPSGTAKSLAGALVEGCPRYSGWNQGRAESGKVNIASLRAGLDTGYHELRYESSFEKIVFSHEALTRDVFATGAIRALRWIRGRKGRYTFDDLAADLITPLFEETI